MTKLIFPVITSKMATRYPEREIEGAKPNLRKKIKIFSRKLLIVFVIKSGYYIYISSLVTVFHIWSYYTELLRSELKKKSAPSKKSQFILSVSFNLLKISK